MRMRTMLILALLSVGLLVAGTGISGAGVIDTKSVLASATLPGVNTLSVTAMNYSGVGTPTSIAFGDVSPGTGFLVPGQYIKVAHDDNSLAWEIKIHTNNFGVNVDTWDPYDPAKYGVNPATTTWGFQYGGMKGLKAGARTPMGWHAGIANSLSSKFAVGSATASVTTGWNFVKDHADRDDPSPLAPGDESYKGADGKASYANVAYGSPDKQYVIDPRQGEAGGYRFEDFDKTFVVEVEGCFGSAPADTYETTIYFDLVHQ